MWAWECSVTTLIRWGTDPAILHENHVPVLVRGGARVGHRSAPSLSAAARGWGIAATPPALAEDRDVRSEPRGKRSAAGSRAQRASRRCPALSAAARGRGIAAPGLGTRTGPRRGEGG